MGGFAFDPDVNFSYAVAGCAVCIYGLRDLAECPCGACAQFQPLEPQCARNLCENLVPLRCQECVSTSTSAESCRQCLNSVVYPPQYNGQCDYLATAPDNFCNPDVGCGDRDSVV